MLRCFIKCLKLVIHQHVGFDVGVGRHFVFKPTFFRLFDTHENSKFPTFLMIFAGLNER